MKAQIEVHITVEVTVDESKFTPEFLAEFRESKDIDAHLKHLGQLWARGMADNWTFIEGYGQADDFGIKFRLIEQYEDRLT